MPKLAGTNAENAEALYGLVREFFYAGAGALLVSHWQVDSAATVKLITSAVRATSRDESIGRAEAHPSYWAPFLVVGEGGAAMAR